MDIQSQLNDMDNAQRMERQTLALESIAEHLSYAKNIASYLERIAIKLDTIARIYEQNEYRGK